MEHEDEEKEEDDENSGMMLRIVMMDIPMSDSPLLLPQCWHHA